MAYWSKCIEMFQKIAHKLQEQIMLTLNLSSKGLNLIKKYEGFKPLKHLCPAGIPTIGYGHVLKKGEEDYKEISKNKAEELLSQDVKIAESTIKKNVMVKLTQNQFDALVSLVYNWGSGNFLRSNLLKKLNAGDYNDVISRFRTIIKANGKILPGLVNRREEEIRLFLQET